MLFAKQDGLQTAVVR